MMLKLYIKSFTTVLLRLLGAPKFLLLLVSVTLMSLVYMKGSIKDLPIAIIDQDHTHLSYQLVRYLKSSEKVNVEMYSDLRAANQDINERKLFAVIIIPRSFEKHFTSGRSITLPAYGDASSRLANGMIQQDLLRIYQQFVDDYNTDLLQGAGFTESQIDSVIAPINTHVEPLYNPGLLLAAITFPGLLVMLLQHSLLIAATRTTITLNSRPDGRPPIAIYLGSLSGLVPIWLFLAIVLYGIWPWIVGYRQLANMGLLLILMLPFLFSVICFAKFLTEMLTKIEMIYLTLAFLTTPVFYLTGSIWPIDAMPKLTQCIAYLLPSTWATNMIVGVNQMGLSFGDVFYEWCMLILLGGFYLFLSLLLSRLKSRQLRRRFTFYKGRKPSQ